MKLTLLFCEINTLQCCEPCICKARLSSFHSVLQGREQGSRGGRDADAVVYHVRLVTPLLLPARHLKSGAASRRRRLADMIGLLCGVIARSLCREGWWCLSETPDKSLRGTTGTVTGTSGHPEGFTASICNRFTSYLASCILQCRPCFRLNPELYL